MVARVRSPLPENNSIKQKRSGTWKRNERGSVHDPEGRQEKQPSGEIDRRSADV